MEQYTILISGGIFLMGAAVVGAVAAAAALTLSGKRLKAQLEKEYGPSRRGK